MAVEDYTKRGQNVGSFLQVLSGRRDDSLWKERTSYQKMERCIPPFFILEHQRQDLVGYMKSCASTRRSLFLRPKTPNSLIIILTRVSTGICRTWAGKGKKAIGELSHDYYAFEKAAIRIHKHLPDVWIPALYPNTFTGEFIPPASPAPSGLLIWLIELVLSFESSV